MSELSPHLRELKRCFIVPAESASLIATRNSTMNKVMEVIRFYQRARRCEAMTCEFAGNAQRASECRISADAAAEILAELKGEG